MREAGRLIDANPSILAAFDMALYDIAGQAAGLPLFRFLGGEKVAIETDITADLDTPERMAERAAGFAASGFRKIKIKVGQDPDLDLARLAAIRKTVGSRCAISIDANQGWTVPQAIIALGNMEEFRVDFVEQPVAAWDIAGLREVRRRSPIPVMADEALFSPHDAINLVRAEACDYFNIKLMKCGGVRNALKIAHISEGANLRSMVGCMLETRLALTAARARHVRREKYRFRRPRRPHLACRRSRSSAAWNSSPGRSPSPKRRDWASTSTPPFSRSSGRSRAGAEDIVSIMEGPPGAVTVIDGKRCLYFGGTGYFGLQGHPALIRAGVEAFRAFGTHGATSRAGFGNNPVLARVEARLEGILRDGGGRSISARAT